MVEKKTEKLIKSRKLKKITKKTKLWKKKLTQVYINFIWYELVHIFQINFSI